MFSIVQSHKLQTLVADLGTAYSQKISTEQSIFDEFIVLVPSMVLGDWLQKQIATQYGITTMVTTTFWGQYQWQLMQTVLEPYNQQLKETGQSAKIVTIPEVAVLSSTVMQWRLFAYLFNNYTHILADQGHTLHEFLYNLMVDTDNNTSANSTNNNQKNQQQQNRLWQLSKEFVTVFNRYLTHRSEWLDLWITGHSINIQALIDEKDQLNQKFANLDDDHVTPDWLVEHYVELEKVQKYLFTKLFAGAYQYRKQIETNFWQAMTDHTFRQSITLPKNLYLFTVQQLPLSELEFLQKLSQFIDITLFHYNPSQMFWADIVDKRWLTQQQVINPTSVYLRDYGHTLLSRLGKQSRETFASLASLSGNEYSKKFTLRWYDDFDLDDDLIQNFDQLSLLKRLQHDVLMLAEESTAEHLNKEIIKSLQQQEDNDEALTKQLKEKKIPNDRFWQLSYDNSLQIHTCYSLQRQLEILRIRLAYWLNGDNSRKLSDIVVLLPDVERHYDLIRSVFVKGVGQDGLYLPAIITGVVDQSIRQLWQAICGYYSLLGAKFARFEAEEVLEWLSLPTMAQSLDLTAEQITRATELLISAGFVRGFDEQHLQHSLNPADSDYRFSFAHALDRLVLGLLMPQASMSDSIYPHSEHWATDTIAEQTLPLTSVTLNDAPIINALCCVYRSLDRYRGAYSESKSPSLWIEDIERQIIQPSFAVYDQTKELRAIFKAMNGFRRSLRANDKPETYYPQYKGDATHADTSPQNQQDIKQTTLHLPLEFVLESIEAELESQQISAESTGVITFSRFGSLRTVPYPLVIMLNMNLSEFPRQDKNDRYDLMKSGLSKRGDRSSEDDDNGSFLDAVLCASDSCWIFYNGRSLHDDHEHLPATPVTELLQFLQGEIHWQLPNDIDNNNINNGNIEQQEMHGIKKYLRKLIKDWLVTQHPAVPFSSQVFEIDKAKALTYQSDDELQRMLDELMFNNKIKQQQQIPPTPLWSKVYHTLSNQKYQQISHKTVTLLDATQYRYMGDLIQAKTTETKAILPLLEQIKNTAIHLDIAQLAQQVSHPANHYLQQQQIRIRRQRDLIARQEPLALNGLTRYQIINSLLTDEHSQERLRFDSIMPAGVARQTTLENEQQQLKNRLEELTQFLQQRSIIELTETASLTPCQEFSQIITVDLFNTSHDIQLKGQMPSQPTKAWVQMVANSARPKHLLTFWLSHIYWQISRKTTEQQVSQSDGESICYFNKADKTIKELEDSRIICLPPITFQQAVDELVRWIHFSNLAGYYPMVIMPEYAFTYLKKFPQDDSEYQPQSDDYKNWLGEGYQPQHNTNPYDTSSKHLLWQYILGENQDVNDRWHTFNALRIALESLAVPLFGNMYQALLTNVD